jgi:hypothetical protein
MLMFKCFYYIDKNLVGQLLCIFAMILGLYFEFMSMSKSIVGDVLKRLINYY